jgi:hypothetical protein
VTTIAAPSTTELVRFLLARVDEDEAQLRRLRRDQSRGAGQATDAADGLGSIDRLRTECEAKRDVIGCAQQLLVLRDQPAEKPVRDAAVHLLYALATPYRSHAAFRREWDGRRRS